MQIAFKYNTFYLLTDAVFLSILDSITLSNYVNRKVGRILQLLTTT